MCFLNKSCFKQFYSQNFENIGFEISDTLISYKFIHLTHVCIDTLDLSRGAYGTFSWYAVSSKHVVHVSLLSRRIRRCSPLRAECNAIVRKSRSAVSTANRLNYSVCGGGTRCGDHGLSTKSDRIAHVYTIASGFTRYCRAIISSIFGQYLEVQSNASDKNYAIKMWLYLMTWESPQYTI